ncbi:hypothetical protein CPB84DRAFT_1739295 [Gymnopilus junonius]|uniref:TIGR04076 family protein n=1 Tax=Gymnopilus junonius TaxID=109634 RepID=A0A9P5N8M3_GYMJU|nr:hypothetical protein CPB84DRAFT_1739295 [Gymnopilus junonius]
MMYLPPGQGISIYSLASILPLLATHQRPHLQRNDWMSTDAEIACPDPNCPSRLRITKMGLRTFRRGDVTVTSPLRADEAAESVGGEGEAEWVGAGAGAAGGAGAGEGTSDGSTDAAAGAGGA